MYVRTDVCTCARIRFSACMHVRVRTCTYVYVPGYIFMQVSEFIYAKCVYPCLRLHINISRMNVPATSPEARRSSRPQARRAAPVRRRRRRRRRRGAEAGADAAERTQPAAPEPGLAVPRAAMAARVGDVNGHLERAGADQLADLSPASMMCRSFRGERKWVKSARQRQTNEESNDSKHLGCLHSRHGAIVHAVNVLSCV